MGSSLARSRSAAAATASNRSDANGGGEDPTAAGAVASTNMAAPEVDAEAVMPEGTAGTADNSEANISDGMVMRRRLTFDSGLDVERIDYL